MTAAVLFGTALLGVIAASLLLAGASLSARLSPACSPNEAALEIGLLATALAMAVTSILLVGGAASLGSVSAGCVLPGAIALALDGPRSRARLTTCARAGLLCLRRSPLLWPLPALALLALARGLALPPLSWDALTYHLTYAASWIQHGGVGRFEAGGIWEAYETFPKAGEALFYLAMLPFHADHLVNLVNIPLWLGLALALRACAQRLGVGRRVQDGCCTVIALCPAFSAYITPSYVEVATAFAFTCALGSGLRALRGDPRALFAMWIGLGMAVAVKATALSLPAGGVVVALLCARRDPRAAWRWSLRGALGASLLAAPWYLRNAWACGNPLYPLGLPGFSAGPWAGSTLLRWTLQESSVLSQNALAAVAAYLLAPPPQPYPLGPMALYPIALLLPLFGLLAIPKPRRVAVAALLGLALLLLWTYLVSPWNGIYVTANARFLGPSLIAAGLACALVLDCAPARVQALAGAVLLACAIGYLEGVPIVRQPVWGSPSWLVALGAGAALLALASAAATPAARKARQLRALGLLCGVGALAALPASIAWREQHRAESYRTRTDLHPVLDSFKDFWPRMAELPPSRIAFAVGGIDFTEGWFFYPLFGPDLQHTVRYVDIEADGDRNACRRRGMIRDQPSYQAWLRRLRAQRIDYLLVRGEPLEARWAESHPERFTQAMALTGTRLFRTRWR